MSRMERCPLCGERVDFDPPVEDDDLFTAEHQCGDDEDES